MGAPEGVQEPLLTVQSHGAGRGGRRNKPAAAPAAGPPAVSSALIFFFVRCGGLYGDD